MVLAHVQEHAPTRKRNGGAHRTYSSSSAACSLPRVFRVATRTRKSALTSAVLLSAGNCGGGGNCCMSWSKLDSTRCWYPLVSRCAKCCPVSASTWLDQLHITAHHVHTGSMKRWQQCVRGLGLLNAVI